MSLTIEAGEANCFEIASRLSGMPTIVDENHDTLVKRVFKEANKIIYRWEEPGEKLVTKAIAGLRAAGIHQLSLSDGISSETVFLDGKTDMEVYTTLIKPHTPITDEEKRSPMKFSAGGIKYTIIRGEKKLKAEQSFPVTSIKSPESIEADTYVEAIMKYASMIEKGEGLKDDPAPIKTNKQRTYEHFLTDFSPINALNAMTSEEALYAASSPPPVAMP